MYLAGSTTPGSTSPRTEITISVIVPLIFVRGPTQRAIESWTQRQSLARRRYEVIVVSPGDCRETERLVRGFLDPCDKLVRADTENLYALYDIGIRQSLGRIVMITESHVVATRHCLRNMVQTLDATENEAACCNALSPGNEGYLASMEAMLFSEESNQWIPDGSWRRVHERGFAIYRDTYDRSGGFPHEYGWFAGRAFAARLHEAGVPVTYADNVRVVHFNSVTTKDIIEGARSFVFGELRYRESEPEARVNRYFGHSNALEARARHDRALALIEVRARLDRIKNCGWPHRLRALPGLAYQTFRCMFGIGLPTTEAWLQAYAARARVALLRLSGPSAGLNAYRDYWHRRLVRCFQLEYCRDNAYTGYEPGPTSIRATDIRHLLTGFHPIEEVNGQLVRWTRSLAAVRVGIPRGATRIRITTIPVEMPLEHRELALYVDGTKLQLEFEQQDVVSTVLDNGDDGRQSATLVMTCEPIRFVDDPRELGVLLKGIDVTTI